MSVMRRLVVSKAVDPTSVDKLQENPVRDREMLSEMPVFSAKDAPTFDPKRWRLRVDGLVDRALELRLERIMDMPSTKIRDDFSCLEGWSVPGLVWEGVKVSDILKLAKVKDEAKCALFVAGSFTLCLDMARCEQPTTILAYKMKGSRLSFEHGAPLRLILAGQQCFESVKWVHEIDLIAAHTDGSAERIALQRVGRLESSS